MSYILAEPTLTGIPMELILIVAAFLDLEQDIGPRTDKLETVSRDHRLPLPAQCSIKHSDCPLPLCSDWQRAGNKAPFEVES